MADVNELIKVEREENGLATVTLNRPKSMNSMSQAMIIYLAEIFKSLSEDSNVRVIILTGAGRAFCAGVDLNAAQGVFQKEKFYDEEDPTIMMGRCKQPIIGAINGYAITGGFELALACDILIASRDAKFMDTHAKFGIFPSWGLSQKLSRLIGVNRARHVSLSAMPIDAVTAERWGLVSQVVPPGELMKTARALAETILSHHGEMVQDYKAVIGDGLKLPLGVALLLEEGRARAKYKAMSPQDFENMQKFIAARSKPKQASSKL
ncbi:unnamed protein product [Calypogeia fissa]